MWVNISLLRNASPARGARDFHGVLTKAARESRAHLRWAFVVGLQRDRGVIHLHGVCLAVEARPEAIVVPKPPDLDVVAEQFVPGRRSVEYLDKHGVIHHGIYCPRRGCRRRGCSFEKPPSVSEILEDLR